MRIVLQYEFQKEQTMFKPSAPLDGGGDPNQHKFSDDMILLKGNHAPFG
jgi:hypothetical protein